MGPCAFCLQTVDVPATCPRCRALYHPDCWITNDYRCAIYGCEPARAPDPTPPTRPVVLQPLQPPGANMGWIVFAVILASSLLRFASSGIPERPSWTPPPSERTFTLPSRTHAEILIGESDRIAAAMVHDPLPTDAGIRFVWRRNVDVAVDRLREARTLLSPGEVLSMIEPRLADLKDLGERLRD